MDILFAEPAYKMQCQVLTGNPFQLHGVNKSSEIYVQINHHLTQHYEAVMENGERINDEISKFLSSLYLIDRFSTQVVGLVAV